ncbi:MAG TPA: TIGR04282 family arsenosugar biosynthesis glycosyltransferase [Candidatus Dormibacteraeota bacterium]|nr:TIGR04282 family arsenosugar biosynthesis glycosyltransferase [Candidatus Dormibacteraeota bacterium]
MTTTRIEDTGPRLYIAARAPRPGQVKTRLAAGIGDDAAAALYAAFLRDLGARFESAPFRLGWYVTPTDAWSEIRPLVGAGPATRVRVQPEADWTDRQRHLLRRASEEGERPVVLIASDSPQLGLDQVTEAFAHLHDHDLVLGPTHDGGYSLIGMRGWHDVLSGIVMSGRDVADRIRQRARTLRLRLATLAPIFDIDEREDLALLDRYMTPGHDLHATRSAMERLGLVRAVQHV